MASTVSAAPSGEVSYSTSAKKMAKASGAAEIRSVDITPAANGGFVARCSYKQPSGAGTDKPAPYVDPDDMAFGSKAELVAWLNKELPGDTARESTQTESARAPMSGAVDDSDMASETA